MFDDVIDYISTYNKFIQEVHSLIKYLMSTHSEYNVLLNNTETNIIIRYSLNGLAIFKDRFMIFTSRTHGTVQLVPYMNNIVLSSWDDDNHCYPYNPRDDLPCTIDYAQVQIPEEELFQYNTILNNKELCIKYIQEMNKDIKTFDSRYSTKVDFSFEDDLILLKTVLENIKEVNANVKNDKL